MFTADTEIPMSMKETAEKNATEIARVLKGSAITQLGRTGAALLEKHAPKAFTRGTDDAELVDDLAERMTKPVLMPGEKIDFSKPAKSSFAEQVKEAMGFAGDEDKAKAGTLAYLATVPPPLERVQVSVAMLEESPSNPRKTFVGLAELAQSMKKLGQLQAIIVRPLPSGGYQVVAGHRRLRAAKLPDSGIETLAADVRSLTDAQVMEIQLAENLQRSDLSALEEAEGYEWLHTSIGMTVEQIADKLGKTKATVYGRMKLLELSSTCRKALAEGKIPMSVAAPLARCGRQVDQDKALKAILARAENNGGEVNARAEIEWLQKEFTRSMKSPPFSVKDGMLLEGTGPCTTCPKRTTNMPRELFDTRSPPDVCTDVPCFVAKSRATFDQAAKLAAEKHGAKVLSVEEGASIFRFDTLGPDSNLVELDTPTTQDPKRRHWRELFDKLPEEKRPQILVAPDRQLTPRFLIDRKEVTKAIAEETGMKWAVEATSAAPRKTKEERSAAREEKHEAKARTAAALIAIQKIAQSAAKGLAPGEWSILFEAVSSASSWKAEVFEALQVKNFTELDRRIKKAPVQEVIAATLTLALVEGGHCDAEEGYTAELKALAKARGVDLASIEKACLVMPGAAGDEKPKKRAKK